MGLGIFKRVNGAFVAITEGLVSIFFARYANMDYIFASAIRFTQLLIILISYDIVCQWFVNFWKRATESFPQALQPPSNVILRPHIPKLHEPAHQKKDHARFSFNLSPGVGLTDGECPERIWALHNGLGNTTKNQGPGSRHDVLDDHFGFWNWLKYIGMGKFSCYHSLFYAN